MKLPIVTVPHPSLRQPAKAVKRVDSKLVKLVKDVSDTLRHKQKPAGVGLAAPQVNKGKRLFAMNLPPTDNPEGPEELTVYINPEIVTHAEDQSFGPDPDHPTLEGCLSIPGLYGPVPRWPWIEVRYQELIKNELLVEKTARFEWFPARVFQHELDHLNGVLFTDYSLKFELPVYQENRRGKFEEIDPSILETF